MATPPTRVSYNAPATGNFSTTTSPKTTGTFNVTAGDIIVVLCSVENGGAQSVVTPTASGGSVTWTQRVRQPAASNSSTSGAWCWTGVVGATATGITVSLARPTTDTTLFWGMSATVYSNHGGVGTTFSGTNGTGANSAPSVAGAVACGANSAVVCQINDWNAADGTTRTWRTINGAAETETVYFRDAAHHTVYGAFRADTGAAGVVTQGLTAPTGQRWVLSGVEILGTTGGGGTTFAADGTAISTSAAVATVASRLVAAATVAALSTSAATVTALLPSTGQAASTSTAAGAATSRLPASGSAASTSAATGSASVIGGAQQYPAAGTAASTSTATGVTTARLVASGTAASVSTATGAATALLIAQGTAASTSAASGSATVIANGSLESIGTVASSSTATGSTTLLARAAGAATATSSATASATALLVAAGVSASTSTATGSATIRVDPGTLRDITVTGFHETRRTVAFDPTPHPITYDPNQRDVAFRESTRRVTFQQED